MCRAARNADASLRATASCNLIGTVRPGFSRGRKNFPEVQETERTGRQSKIFLPPAKPPAARADKALDKRRTFCFFVDGSHGAGRFPANGI